MTDGTALFDSREVSLKPLAWYVAEHDHALTRIVARTPIPVVSMAADRFGQAKLWPIEVDRSCLAVVIPNNGRPRSFIGGNAVVDLRDCRNHLGPATAVSQHLRQLACLTVFEPRLRDANEVRVADVRFRRQQRQHDQRS